MQCILWHPNPYVAIADLQAACVVSTVILFSRLSLHTHGVARGHRGGPMTPRHMIKISKKSFDFRW